MLHACAYLGFMGTSGSGPSPTACGGYFHLSSCTMVENMGPFDFKTSYPITNEARPLCVCCLDEGFLFVDTAQVLCTGFIINRSSCSY
jgi:hypothetical protein